MPLYGFSCDKCGNEFETLVSASETAHCPKCESTRLTRLLSLIAKPSKGSSAGDFCGASGGDLPPCATGPCCGGGACSH